MKLVKLLTFLLVFVAALFGCATAEQVKFEDVRVGLEGVVVIEVGGQTVAIDAHTGLVIGERRSDVIVRRWSVATTVDFSAMGSQHAIRVSTDHTLGNAGWRRCYGVVGTFFGAIAFDKCYAEEGAAPESDGAQLQEEAPAEGGLGPNTEDASAGPDMLVGDEGSALDVAPSE